MERALIIRKRWLDKILDGGKVWEMRSTKTNVRGKIGLIESGTGLIMGEASLVDCLGPIDCSDAGLSEDKHHVLDHYLLEKWKFPWVLAGAKRYNEPIPYRHPKGAVIWVKQPLESKVSKP